MPFFLVSGSTKLLGKTKEVTPHKKSPSRENPKQILKLTLVDQGHNYIKCGLHKSVFWRSTNKKIGTYPGFKKLYCAKKITRNNVNNSVSANNNRSGNDILFFYLYHYVVYFDQHLGAAHSKRWSKSSFSAFLLQKTWNKQEFCSKFQ